MTDFKNPTNFYAMVTFLFLLLNFAWAENPSTLFQPKCACVVEISDPFETPVAFNYGKNKGLCIDSCRFRPVHIISVNTSKEKFELANILHFSLFYKAEINLNDIESTDVGFEEFTPGVHHVFLKFNFKNKKGIKIFDQNSSDQNFKEIQSLVISAEGVPAKGKDYSLIEGAMGQYLFFTRILTDLEHQRWTKSLGNPVTFYRLNLDEKQSAHSFLQAIESSHLNGPNEIYQLFTNNCSTKAYSFFSDLIKDSKIKDLSWLQKISLAIPIVGPISTYSFLKNEKLIR